MYVFAYVQVTSGTYKGQKRASDLISSQEGMEL